MLSAYEATSGNLTATPTALPIPGPRMSMSHRNPLVIVAQQKLPWDSFSFNEGESAVLCFQLPSVMRYPTDMGAVSEKRRASRRKSMVTTLTRGFDTSDFDRQFWAQASSEDRLEAGWQLAVQAHLHRGGKKSELRLQRSFAVLKRGPS